MSEIVITPFERRYRQSLDDLLFRHYQVHTHLDWRDVSDWLDTTQSPVRLAWQQQRLVGVLGVAAPLNHTTWFRLAVLHDHMPGEEIMGALWENMASELHRMDTRIVSVLVTRSWVEHTLLHLGFHFQEEIITMRRDGEALPVLRPAGVTIRFMRVTDLQDIMAVDQQAFAPPWQLTLDELRLATRIASSYTVALHEENLVGYQISTVYRDGAHLARLAVLPGAQGQGVGSALLDDALRRFFKRRVYTMTVNTQIGNIRSQQLYARFGFQRNGYDLPVWSIAL